MSDVAGTIEPQISREMVLVELEKILSSGAFINTNRLGVFLGHVVRQTLDGNAENLKEYQIGLDVFGRQESYDTRTDPVVRVGARQLRFKLDEYYREFGESDPVVISLPKGRYVPRFELRKIPPVPLPEPIPAPPAAVPEIETRPGYRSVAMIAVGILGIAAMVVLLTRSKPVPAAAGRSIAVLPFKNLSNDPSNQYFADGLVEEITNELTHIPGLRVIARSSVASAGQKSSDIHEIGRQLGIADVVEGTIERSGDRIKIVAHLQQVSDGALIWSNAYDRQASDLLNVQGEIASGIAHSLNAAGLPVAARVPDQKAQDAVWRGEFDLVQANPEALNHAEADFRKAVDIDPEYGAPYALLAIVKYNRALFSDSHNIPAANREEIESLARTALRLDPRLAAARGLLASLALQFDWDWKGAEQEYRQALAAAPDPNVANQYSMLLCFENRFAEADQQLHHAQEQDPIGEPTLYQMALVRLLEGRFSESREISQRLAEIAPQSTVPISMMANCYLNEHKPDLAAPLVKKLSERQPVSTIQAALEVQYGQRAEALRLIQPYEDQYPNTKVQRTAVAVIYAALKDEPNTVKWLNRAADDHEMSVLNAGVLPVYAPIRKSNGFQALLKRIGLQGK
jgi:TolB-like protein/Tfp pilus assembly protein PilF